MKYRLEIDGVLAEFNGLQVLNNIFLKCETGKVTGILGRNGAGKSTLFRVLFGEYIPESSSVRINGKSLLGAKRHPSDVRYLPQFEFIPSELRLQTVFNLFGLDLLPFIKSFPDFEGLNQYRINTLSGGQRRLIEVYCILKAPSKFCFLDEPFSQIMPLHIDKIKELMVEEKDHKGILCSDHMYHHILEISDEISLLHQGSIYPVQTTNDLTKYGYTKE